MTISQIANLMSLPIGIICLIISIRAYYIYHLSQNDMLLVLSLSMASISFGTLIGTATTAHLGGNSYNSEFTRAFGSRIPGKRSGSMGCVSSSIVVHLYVTLYSIRQSRRVSVYSCG